MDVNGLVTAASEKINLELADGLLFTLYNGEMDIHFYILVCDMSATVWTNVIVNHYYTFTGLTIGVLETSVGGKRFLFKTTSTSSYIQIDSHESNKFEIGDDLEALISVPGLSDLYEIKLPYGSDLISYKGIVTDVKDVELGIYEIDSKVSLYITFNISNTILSKGSEIFVSNAHLIQDYMEKIILVCCGLSSVRNINGNEIQASSKFTPHSTNFCLEYELSMFDFLWLERLSERLKMKFYSLVSEEDISFKGNPEFLRNLLDYFVCFNDDNSSKKFSLMEEYFSNPHRCFPFLENRISVECDVPYLANILDEVIEDISWIVAGNKWKYAINSQNNMVLIGMLFLSDDGNFYVADQTLKLPVIFTQECDECRHDQNIEKDFENPKMAHIIAIQEYDVIFESLYCKNKSQKLLQYIRTSSCRVYSLLSFHKSEMKESNLPYQIFFHKWKKDVKSNGDVFGPYGSPTNNKHFLVLSKIWTIQSKIPCCFRILVLFIPEKCEIIDSYNLKSQDILKDTFNYYETGDDAEFASLISKLNSLFIDDQLKLTYLSFKSSEHATNLFPGHIYIINLKESICNNNVDSFSSEYNKNRIFTWTITSDVEIIHDPTCLGKHCLENYEVSDVTNYGVKEVLSIKQLKQNCFVTCVLHDKTYEDVENTHNENSGRELKATLCMTLKDVVFEEYIKVYVPYFSSTIFGLLPGTLLELHGFHCISSQSGNLYLKASSMFGILVKSCQSIPKEYPVLAWRKFMTITSGNIFHTSFRRLCFILKIISAEVFSICNTCSKTFLEKCSCLTYRQAKIKASALIDDGNQQLLAHCSGEAAKNLLNVNEKEWLSLATYVESSHQSLKFSEKVLFWNSSYSSFMNQIFNVYCCSKSVCQKKVFEFIYLPNSSTSDTHSVWCKSVTDPVPHELMLEFYKKSKDIHC
ncbi:uncharacterized protein TNIN_404981 [Trichonephila inaurata madagascariensis]|uniref:CST complex subunit CTC1 n=1 Tax=Trichonephila inaurata madagascariensis TaxID=2747483 RepID=A0A8X6XRF6_9ARAC|nr:uncharacterized protein TNIN_404981 [Trichonephila inaurata madagascariensis]